MFARPAAAHAEISAVIEINRIIRYPSPCNGSTVFKSLHLFLSSLPSLPFLLNMEVNPHPPTPPVPGAAARDKLSESLCPMLSYALTISQHVSAWQVRARTREDAFRAPKQNLQRLVFLISKQSGLHRMGKIQLWRTLKLKCTQQVRVSAPTG